MDKVIARRQKQMSRALERRERRRQNEMLIIAIRKLVRTGDLPGYFARFWEGALGNASYRLLIRDSLNLALNEEGLIHSISSALNLLDAMHARDLSELASTLGEPCWMLPDHAEWAEAFRISPISATF